MSRFSIRLEAKPGMMNNPRWPDHLQSPSPSPLSDSPILAIDVGAGTQDVLLYDPAREPENSLKLVLPSQTQIVGARVREATAAGLPIHLHGLLMGGGASTDAMKDHLAAGLTLSATADAARTIHNDLERVQALGVEIRADAPPGAVVIETGDVDLNGLATALAPFGIELPRRGGLAGQDHGFLPG